MRYPVFIFFMFCAIASFAQDLIIPKTGDPIKAYNVEIGSTHLFYQLENESNANIIRIAKKDVLMIRKADGSVLNIENVTSNNITNNNIEIEEEEEEDIDDGFPIIPEDSIKGLLIAEGNCVFIPTDSPIDYEKAGQKALKKLIKEWGYWNVVNKPEKSHFILQFITKTDGKDTSWLVFRPRSYYRNYPTITDKSTAGVMIAYTGSNEDVEDNKKMAKNLFSFFKGMILQKRNKEYSEMNSKDTKAFLIPKVYKIFDASAFEKESKKTLWKPRHIY